MSNMQSSVQQQERVEVLDVLRGIALAGIMIINAMSILAVKGSTPAFTIALPFFDRLLQDAILFFIESKFFTLFSLLFGIGFAIQLQSAERQGLAFGPRIVRRMGGLLLFGMLHIIFLWDGDILVIYAITGMLLIAFRSMTTARLLKWSVGLLAVPALLVSVLFVYTNVARYSPEAAQSFIASDRTIAEEFANTDVTQRLRESGFIQGIPVRIQTYFDLLPLLISRIPTVLAMFLVGLAVGKSDFLRNVHNNTALLQKVRRWGLFIGCMLMLLIVTATKMLPTTTALIAIIQDQYLAGPILSLGYTAALTMAFLSNPLRKIYRFLASVGRMALTNYLMQSLVLCCLAYGWGFGYAMQLDGLEVIGICALLYLFQIMYSHLWLTRFSYGPCEWLWRAITYWRWPAMRT